MQNTAPCINVYNHNVLMSTTVNPWSFSFYNRTALAQFMAASGSPPASCRWCVLRRAVSGRGGARSHRRQSDPQCLVAVATRERSACASVPPTGRAPQKLTPYCSPSAWPLSAAAAHPPRPCLGVEKQVMFGLPAVSTPPAASARAQTAAPTLECVVCAARHACPPSKLGVAAPSLNGLRHGELWQ